MITALIVVLAFGAAGAFLGHRFAIPAGVLVGTLVGVAMGANIEGMLIGSPLQLSVPSWSRGLLQVMLGMLVGFRIDSGTLRSGLRALVPAFLLVVILIPSAVVSSQIASFLTSLSEVTALFAAIPGGITEMSTLSLSFGADGIAVASVQLLRLVLAVAVVSILLKRIGSKDEEREPPPHSQKRQDRTLAEKEHHAEDLRSLGVALPWGILGGLIGIATSIPAGGMIGALICSVAFRLVTGREVSFKPYQIVVQTLAGGVIGLQVSGNLLGQLVQIGGAGALIISTQLLLWLGASWLLVKLFRYSFPTSVLASSPGGISGVIPAAGEAGADAVVVSFVQMVRLSAIIVVVPELVALVLWL